MLIYILSDLKRRMQLAHQKHLKCLGDFFISEEIFYRADVEGTKLTKRIFESRSHSLFYRNLLHFIFQHLLIDFVHRLSVYCGTKL